MRIHSSFRGASPRALGYAWARAVTVTPREVLVAACAVVALLGLAARPVSANTTATTVSPTQAQGTFQQDSARLNQLTQQLQTTQAKLTTLNQKLAQDQKRQDQLQSQLEELARLEYEVPVIDLGSILTATSLSELQSDLSQASLVSSRQDDLLQQATQLRKQDRTERDKVAAQVAQIKSARAQAAKVAEEALSEANAANAAQANAVANQAASLACNPSANPAGCPSGSIQQIIIGAFSSQGQAAVDWGLTVAKCESTYNPNAVNPSGAEGLFQFMPSTFAATPPGRAGQSIWSPVASSEAAAWMYSQGRQGEWECNP